MTVSEPVARLLQRISSPNRQTKFDKYKEAERKALENVASVVPGLLSQGLYDALSALLALEQDRFPRDALSLEINRFHEGLERIALHRYERICGLAETNNNWTLKKFRDAVLAGVRRTGKTAIGLLSSDLVQVRHRLIGCQQDPSGDLFSAQTQSKSLF